MDQGGGICHFSPMMPQTNLAFVIAWLRRRQLLVLPNPSKVVGLDLAAQANSTAGGFQMTPVQT